MGTKQFDSATDLITFSRASSATYLDSDGILQTATTDTPRIEYDANGVVKGLLIEKARTNLVTRSEVTATADLGWSDSSSTSTNLDENALGVFQGVSIASGGGNWNRRSIECTVTSGTVYAATVFYRAGTSNRARFVFRDTDGAVESRVGGVIGSLAVAQETAGTLSILTEEDLPDNVKKITIKFTPNFTGTCGFGIGPDSVNSGETVIAYGAQLEEGPFATSYIETTGSTATRSADIASIPVTDFGWHGGEAGSGTIVVDAQSNNWQFEENTQYLRVFEFNGHANNGLYRAAVEGNGDQFRFRLSDKNDGAALGPTTIGVSSASATDGAKVAIAYAPDNFAVSSNGAINATDDSGTFDTLSVTNISIGKGNGNSIYFNGHIKSIKYYPRRLTNAQLQEITS